MKSSGRVRDPSDPHPTKSSFLHLTTRPCMFTEGYEGESMFCKTCENVYM